eukprot:5029113-Pleurochrysis_carterae.AAC.1
MTALCLTPRSYGVVALPTFCFMNPLHVGEFPLSHCRAGPFDSDLIFYFHSCQIFCFLLYQRRFSLAACIVQLRTKLSWGWVLELLCADACCSSLDLRNLFFETPRISCPPRAPLLPIYNVTRTVADVLIPRFVWRLSFTA